MRHIAEAGAGAPPGSVLYFAHSTQDTELSRRSGGAKGEVDWRCGNSSAMLGERQPLCDCTSLTWDEVTEQIRVRRLMRVFDVIDALDWRNLEGCPKCRQALYEYLHMQSRRKQ